jgi:hypothetical protein
VTNPEQAPFVTHGCVTDQLKANLAPLPRAIETIALQSWPVSHLARKEGTIMRHYGKASHCLSLLMLFLLEQHLCAATSAYKSRVLHLDGKYLRAESSATGEISLVVYRDNLGRDVSTIHSRVIPRSQGQVVSIDIGAWKNDSCFVVLCLKEESFYRYIGIAFDYRTDSGERSLSKGQKGTLFYSKERYDMIHINPLAGDSISITFLATEELDGGKIRIKSGVLLVNHCPVIPSPSFLYSLDGKLIYNEMDALLKSSNFTAAPPIIPEPKSAEMATRP